MKIKKALNAYIVENNIRSLLFKQEKLSQKEDKINYDTIGIRGKI